MSALVYSHPDIFLHDLEADHQAMESERIETIYRAVASASNVELKEAPLARREDFLLAHSLDLVDRIFNNAPTKPDQTYALDQETRMNRRTLAALRRSAGAALAGLDDALAGRALGIFCVSYAGHHASPKKSGGFCFFNPVAMCAAAALQRGVSRVAILDFDTHAGNGTILSFLHEPRALFAETYQPGYPGHFMPGFSPSHIHRARCEGAIDFRAAWTRHFEAIEAFSPELIILSAGFDAHEDDPLGIMGLQDQDYQDFARRVMNFNVPVIACLEGGYNVASTARCAALFVQEMANH